MPILLDTRSLRDAPDGNRLRDVLGGTRVSVGTVQGEWVQITLVDEPGAPTGWVIAKAVDLTTDIPGTLDKLVFARQCHLQALIDHVSAHYLAAVATLRSDMMAMIGPSGSGPYAFTAAEWALNGQPPPVGATAASIGSWSLQISVFAMMTRSTQLAFVQALGRQPTATELYFAQLVGATAAVAAIPAPTTAMSAVLAGVTAAQAQADRIDPTCLTGTGRDARLLGTGTVADALQAISVELQKALDACRTFVSSAGDALIAQDRALLATGTPGGINFDSPAIPNGRKGMARLIADRFGERGYGVTQQIAAIANAIAESGLEPEIKSNFPGENSWGLFQLNTAAHAVGHGHAPSELIQPEANIRIMLDFIATNSADAAFRATTNVHEAVSIFVHDFENPDGQPEAIELRSGIAAKLVA